MAHHNDGKPHISYYNKRNDGEYMIPDCSIAHTIYTNRQPKPTLWRSIANLSFAFWVVYAAALYGIVWFIFNYAR